MRSTLVGPHPSSSTVDTRRYSRLTQDRGIDPRIRTDVETRLTIRNGSNSSADYAAVASSKGVTSGLQCQDRIDASRVRDTTRSSWAGR